MATLAPHSGHGTANSPRLSYPHAAHRPRLRLTTPRPNNAIGIATPHATANTPESTANPRQIGHNGSTRADPGVASAIALTAIPPRVCIPLGNASSNSHHIDSIGHPRASSPPDPALDRSPANTRGSLPHERSCRTGTFNAISDSGCNSSQSAECAGYPLFHSRLTIPVRENSKVATYTGMAFFTVPPGELEASEITLLRRFNPLCGTHAANPHATATVVKTPNPPHSSTRGAAR